MEENEGSNPENPAGKAPDTGKPTAGGPATGVGQGPAVNEDDSLAERQEQFDKLRDKPDSRGPATDVGENTIPQE